MSSVYTYNAIFIVHVIHDVNTRWTQHQESLVLDVRETLWNKNAKQNIQNSTVFNLYFELSLDTKVLVQISLQH